MTTFGMMPPHWLDDVIDSAIASNNPKKIAEAIANSSQLQNAIREGLQNTLRLEGPARVMRK